MCRVRIAILAITVVGSIAGCQAETKSPASVPAPKASAVRFVAATNDVADADAARPPAAGPQLVPPTNEAPATPAAKDGSSPHSHTAFYRADTSSAKMPTVKFTKREVGLCKVKVGDAMPAIALPQIGGGSTKLADLLGKKATVVVFWKGDRRMTRTQLADITPDVIEPFGKAGVAVVGVAVNESDTSAPEVLTKAGAKFTNLLDADGKAFAQVGSERLPRTYVLDPSGKIVWFDIEYSLTTRRELHEALRAVTGKP